MAEIGERLREARMRQRVDISEVEDATKIRAKYLRAIENEEFDLLPGPTFAKSFLRTYAEYLGLDARLLVEEYRVRHEPPPEEDNQHFAPAPSRRVRDYGRAPPGLPWLVGGGVALVLLLFLVIGLVAGDGGDRGPEGGAPPAADRDSDRAVEKDRTERRRERRRRRPAAPAPRSVTMRIVPEEATYVCVDAGPGRVLYEGSVASPRTFRGRRLRLNLGKTSASVRVNGRRVNLGSGANPVGFSFSPRGRPRPLPLGERPCA
ncbi:MAG: helix-turn-helix domain-containing protein [Actinomycetota bacterium]|nr:helix-turn-helix domain-containing protein [Actinomycetota bacterium]